MTCPECRDTVPDNFLTCPTCATRRAVLHLEQYQLQFLRMWMKDECNIRTATASGGTRHVLMFGPQERTFCGTQISHPKRAVMTYREGLLLVCHDCRDRLQYLIAEALRAAL